MARLTPRMQNWISGLGGHIATVSADGVPSVIVVDRATTPSEGVIRFRLSDKQLEQVSGNLSVNPRVAIGPGGIGSVRAAYQFKGVGSVQDGDLVVSVDEIYSTKPGPEAGLRLDVLPYDDVVDFERTRWRDDGPPR